MRAFKAEVVNARFCCQLHEMGNMYLDQYAASNELPHKLHETEIGIHAVYCVTSTGQRGLASRLEKLKFKQVATWRNFHGSTLKLWFRKPTRK